MTFSPTGSILATLTHGNRMGALASRLQGSTVSEFICLLDFITAEFQQSLLAFELIDNEALETLLEQLLDAFTQKISQLLDAERAIIFLIDEEQGQLWSSTHSSDSQYQELRLPLDTGVVGHVATTGEFLNLSHPQEHPLFNPQFDEIAGGEARNILCAPIYSSKDNQQRVGVVELLNKTEGCSFNGEDEETLGIFADSIGVILESCQSFYRAARNQRGLNALLEATTTLGKSLDLESTLRAVMERAQELMQADRSTIFLLSRETNELWTKVAAADGQTMMEIRIPATKGIAGYVASTGETVNIPHAYQDPRFDPTTDQRTGYQTRNILCMALYDSAGELMGVTQLINKHKGSFTKSDEEFLKAFNAQAGIALENAQLFEKVMVEKQYQKDILESLSDAVISTDMQGRIVTINEAALELLGCPMDTQNSDRITQLWENRLVGRLVWEVVPVENLQYRLSDSLTTGAKHYVPEQTLMVGVYEGGADTGSHYASKDKDCILAVSDRTNSDLYIPWGDRTKAVVRIHRRYIHPIERSINLTVNPLTNPQGSVRGGLVVLEDISQEKRMKTTMHRYMTPEVAERVMALGEDALMVGERKDVTILFSDIRGYTTLTENLGASEVVALLNQYFETMVEAVFNYEGTLDKFIGDALMAVFGAPLPLTQDHAWMAVQSALDMRQRLQAFNQRRIIDYQPTIRFGIGISSGEVVSGNIGSKKRMDYTVIGDGVNLSSRLENATKEYGCDIIISESTYQLCGDRLWVRELDRIRVKGKNQAVDIYELIGDASQPLDDKTQEFLHLHQCGRQTYLKRDFSQALSYFNAAAALKPSDRTVQLYRDRCAIYLRHPPPDSWDGTYTMLNK